MVGSPLDIQRKNLCSEAKPFNNHCFLTKSYDMRLGNAKSFKIKRQQTSAAL